MAGAFAVGELAARGFQAALAKLKEVSRFAIDSAADYEQSRIAFDTMLGSAQRAQQMLVEISKFAEKTPFELPQVVTGAKQLLAYNVEAEKIIPTFTMLGNIAAGVGRERLPQLILAFGQVKAATKLTGAELRQFSEAGVPLLGTLAKQMGKTEAQVQDLIAAGKVGFQDVEKALASMTGEGGKFFNLMEKQSKTFGGVMSNISDAFGRTVRNIVGISETGEIREGSIFDRLRLGAMQLLAWINANQVQIQEFFQRIIERVIEFGIKVFDYIVTHKEEIAAFFTAMATVIGTAATALFGLTRFVIEHKEVILPLAAIIGGTVLAFKALQAAISFYNTIVAVTAALKALSVTVSFAGTVQALSGAFIGLAATLAVPFVITIIGAGAIYAVKQAVDDLKRSWDSLISAERLAQDTFERNVRRIHAMDISPEEKKRRIQMLVPTRATGGPVEAGQPYITGEEGQELFVPKTDGFIFPHRQTQEILKQAGITQNNVFNVHNNVDPVMIARELGWRLAHA